MLSHRATRAVLAGLAATLVASAPAPARTKPAAPACKAPASGYQSCLRVRYRPADDGTATVRSVSATLLRRVVHCPNRTARRRLTLSRDGKALATGRRAGHCRNGVVRWQATFSDTETARWDLRKGDTLDANWTGVQNAASVTIQGG